MPIAIRSSSYISTPGSSGFTLTLAFPSGTSVGDLVLIFGTNDRDGIYVPAGWTTGLYNNNWGLQIFFTFIYKVMDSADIAAGSVSITMGVPNTAGNQVWAVAATNGAAAVREFPYSFNGIGGGPQSVVTDGAVASSDTAVLFEGIVGNSPPGVSPGTTLGSTTNNCSGILAYDSSLASGVNTFAFTGGGTHASFQIAVVLWSGAPPPLAISCGNPPSGVKGSPYAHTFPASGGTPPYSFSLASGSLPPGLSLNASTGAVTGTPSASGTFPFTVEVTDSAPTTASVACSIIIGGAGPWVIKEVTADLIPCRPSGIPGFGHFRYTVRCVDSAQAGTYQDFWNALGGGGGGGASGGSASGIGSEPPGAPPGPPGAQITVAKNGVSIGSESEINLIEGANITITASDDAANGKVDVTISAPATALEKVSQAFSGVTSVTVNHNLGTSAVIVQCFDNGSPQLQVIPQDVKVTGGNQVVVTFGIAFSGEIVVIG